MAAHEKALLIDSLSNNFVRTAGPAAGTTCSASVSPAAPTSRVMLTNLGWAINNVAGTTGPMSTLTVSSGSIAGTVLASWRITPVGLGSFQDSWTVNIKGKKGVSVAAFWGTPSASVTQSVSMAGWFDTLSDG